MFSILTAVVLLVGFGFPAVAWQEPILATTDDGRRVELYPDGTWRLLQSENSKIDPCQTKTVFVDGKSSLVSKARREAEKWSWMRPVSRKAEAESILEITESSEVETTSFSGVHSDTEYVFRWDHAATQERLWIG